MNDELVLSHAILRYKGCLTVELLNASLIVNSSSQSSMVLYIGHNLRVSMKYTTWAKARLAISVTS